MSPSIPPPINYSQEWKWEKLTLTVGQVLYHSCLVCWVPYRTVIEEGGGNGKCSRTEPAAPGLILWRKCVSAYPSQNFQEGFT